ncbi:hypothetical protein BDV23DRAFT_186462 [Aspergillus alliaceus]|uniref:Uncharacterized protein n=1 Tax=Petromyces alliaceus TaxID=209559 RepID=A0A5N7BZP4_PETAA|nr:hypothetical protein BDV23DRAFT_186462 [Aspergillus alliaceus]
METATPTSLPKLRVAMVGGGIAGLTAADPTSIFADDANPHGEDENLYHNSTTIAEPFSLAQYDTRIYGDEDRHFSSFTYFISAVHILARVVAVAWTHEIYEDHMQTIDNAIAGVVSPSPRRPRASRPLGV